MSIERKKSCDAEHLLTDLNEIEHNVSHTVIQINVIAHHNGVVEADGNAMSESSESISWQLISIFDSYENANERIK